MRRRLQIFLWLLLLLLVAQAMAAAANPAVRPLSLGGIIFPKESFDDCFTDELRHTPGTCKLMEHCLPAQKLWQEQRVMPKTCYFVKFDQYVCCPLETHASLNATKTTPPPPPLELPPRDLPELPTTEENLLPLTRSEIACEDSIVFGISIVGGKPTKYREFPYMAALGWKSNYDERINYRCGGTLISPTFVLTAAHCINFGGQLPTTVRLGGENLTEGMGQDHMIRRVFTHPEYNENTSYNDIALLELDDAMPSTMRIVCVWHQNTLPTDNYTAIGYGQIRFAGLSSSQLLKINLQLYSREECQPHYSADVLSNGLAQSQLCAGDKSGVGDTCQGDSGGPLLMQNGQLWYVIGVTSVGQGCASGPPSIYTRVSSYVDWIEGIVWPKPNEQLQQPTFDLRLSD